MTVMTSTIKHTDQNDDLQDLSSDSPQIGFNWSTYGFQHSQISEIQFHRISATKSKACLRLHSGKSNYMVIVTDEEKSRMVQDLMPLN